MSAKGESDADQRSQRSATAGSEGGRTPRSQSGSRAGSQVGSRAESRSGRSSQLGGLTPRSKTSRVNKIYRTPPTPPPVEQGEKEKGFVLDGNAVSSISCDYSKANPKLGPVIPPYNSQQDGHVTEYFTFIGVDKTLKKTGQKTGDYPIGNSIDGFVMDRFHQEGKGYIYLSNRNQNGAGHSTEEIEGHAQFMQGVKPVIGYNGKYGYRRNNPWLRTMPSPFGTASTSPTH